MILYILNNKLVIFEITNRNFVGYDKRTLLFQARLYRILSIVFMISGLFIFILLYLQNIEGRLADALSEPQTVMIIIFPFVPAFVLSLLAKASENKYLSYKESEKNR